MSNDEELRSVVELIESLEDAKSEAASHVSSAYAEAKSKGFDIKALRRIIQLRRKTEADRRDEDAVLETYMVALGMRPAF
jgi:uncharacterized protein (UPF0335 family)